MRLTRARYVTICQQFLVTAVVVAVGLSAAGVMTLQIVGPTTPPPNASDLIPAITVSDGYADNEVVTPKVSEVKVTGIDATAAKEIPGSVTKPRLKPGATSGSERDSARTAPAAEPGPTTDQADTAAPGSSAGSAPADAATTDGGSVDTGTADGAPADNAPAESESDGDPADGAPTDSTPADAEGAGESGQKLAALSAPEKVHGFATVGVTWQHGTDLSEDQISVQIRTKKDGAWSEWADADYHDGHGPDEGSAEASRVRPGTEPIVVGDVDEVQMRAETDTGEAPADLELALIDPGAGSVSKQPAAIDTAAIPESDRDATSEPPVERTAPAATGSNAGPDTGSATLPTDSGDIALAAMATAPKPTIYSRAQWGANEKMRDKSSLKYGTVKTSFIHHTVNANNYTAEQVPALIRGIYAYHTQSRGWSDIGYNFLVDRFGRIWEGRYGGVDRAVIGAHTLGYNEVSFAMSAIGNFEIAQPPQAVLDAFARLFAWKLSLYGIPARAKGIVVKGKKFKAINGHRDAGSTACPGKYLYAKLVSIRKAAEAIQNGAQDPAAMEPLPVPAGTPVPTRAPVTLTAQPPVRPPARISLAGDAWPDLVTKDASGLIRVLPTAGILGYGPRVVAAKGWGKKSLIAAVGDVTGDRKGDVIARAKGKKGKARVFRLNGAGQVVKPGIAPTKAFRRANLIVGIGDLNKDRRNDVVSRDRRTKSLMLHRGLGGGRFAAPKVLRKKWPYVSTAGVMDLNKDGRVDLVGLSSNGTLWLIPGKKGGKLGARVKLGSVGRGATRVFGVGDLTGDGRKDIAVMRGGATTVYAVTATGLGQAYGPYQALAGLSQLTSGQLNGGRGLEMLGRDSAGRLVVVRHNGRGNVGAMLAGNLRVPGATQILSVGDWNRDGYNDIVTREAGGDVLVLRPGLGNGRFGRGLSFGSGWKAFTQLAAVGDVTGDDYPDLVGKTATGPMTIFPGARNGAFSTPLRAPASLRTYNQIGAAAWRSSGPVLAAGGGFVPLSGVDVGSALRMANGGASAAYNSYVGVGDVDGDGVADVLAREAGTGTIWLLPGKTSGGFAPRVWVAAGFAGYQLIG